MEFHRELDRLKFRRRQEEALQHSQEIAFQIQNSTSTKGPFALYDNIRVKSFSRVQPQVKRLAHTNGTSSQNRDLYYHLEKRLQRRNHPFIRTTASQASKAWYRRKLQRIDQEDYGLEEDQDDSSISSHSDGISRSSSSCRSQYQHSRMDPLTFVKKHHEDLFEELKQRIAFTPATINKSTTSPKHLSISTSTSPIMTSQLKYQEEIDQLEEKIRQHQLTRRTFSIEENVYGYFAQRQLNIILREVVHEELKVVATEEIFDEKEFEEQDQFQRQVPESFLEMVLNVFDEKNNPNEILVQKFNVDLTRRHLQCLVPFQWLNDEVINFWFQLLQERDTQLYQMGQIKTKSYFFNSFFYTKISEKNGYNFLNVRRWTRKIDLFQMDQVFIPINISNTHWCLAVIWMKKKKIQYYDSMNGKGERCLQVLLQYLQDEIQHKKQQTLDVDAWKLVPTQSDTPQQENGCDCGVFTCIFADFLAQKKKLTFSQKDMLFHRQRMVIRILQGEIPIQEKDLQEEEEEEEEDLDLDDDEEDLEEEEEEEQEN